MTQMNILITGITGLLGKHLAGRLSVNKENRIYGIARSPKEELSDVNYTYGEIQNSQTYESLPKRIDICIHTAAAIPSKEDLQRQQECIVTNIRGTLELVKFLMTQCPDVYISMMSTAYVYSSFGEKVKTEESLALPETFYGLSKLYSEATVLKSGLRSNLLRLASFYDTQGDARRHQSLLYDWIDRAREGRDLTIWGTGKERRNYLHIDDVIEAVVQGIERRTAGIYNIASGQTLTSYEIAKTIINVAGSSSKIRIDSEKSIYAPISAINVEKAQHELNFQPKISLASGVQGIIAYANGT